jgi:flagellar biogenesis protein FliO
MFSTAVALALLPTIAVAASGFEDVPVVEDASAELRGDRLAADITTTLPVFHEDLRVKIDGRNLVVYVNGAAISGGKRTFGEGPAAVHALPRATYAKLEIPMPAGQTCALPATVNVEEGLIHVSVACSATGAAAAVTTAKEAVHAVAKAAPKAANIEAKAEANIDPTPAPLRGLLTERTAAAPKERSLAGSTASVVASEPAPAGHEPVAAKAEPKVEPAAAKAEPIAVKAEPAKPESLKAEPLAAKTEPAPIAAAPVDKATTKSDKSPTLGHADDAKSSSPVLVGAGLLAATMVALVLWRRKRVSQSGLIRILETASLGPKRTLVVAEVDGEKMILGTSEAGISVLTPINRTPSPWGEQTNGTQMNLPPGFAEFSKMTNMATLAAAAAHHAASTTAAAPSIPTPIGMAAVAPAEDNEGGLLSRLFRRAPAPQNNDDEDDLANLGNMADEFQDLLADSIEDEELRRRLQAGIGGRTS